MTRMLIKGRDNSWHISPSHGSGVGDVRTFSIGEGMQVSIGKPRGGRSVSKSVTLKDGATPPPRRKEDEHMSEPTDKNPTSDDADQRVKMLELQLAEEKQAREADRTTAAAEKEAAGKDAAKLAEYEQRERDALIKELVERTGKDAEFFDGDSIPDLEKFKAMLPERQTGGSFAPARDEATEKEKPSEIPVAKHVGNNVWEIDGEQTFGGNSAKWGDVYETDGIMKDACLRELEPVRFLKDDDQLRRHKSDEVMLTRMKSARGA